VPVIWPCGRPAAAFPAGAAADEARRRLRGELGIGADDVVFLTAARMHPQKRPLDLVSLARRVRDLERVRFLIVGGGGLEAEVDRAIAAGGARIRRLPFRDDIPELIAASDAGCLVSDFEGLPVFLLECLQAGRPFLGTDVGDMGEVLRSTGAGLVVGTPGDLDALEAAVRRLADDGERAPLAARAAAAGARFDPAACAAAYGDVFLGRAR
jgi:glycosyltransferase involved in cell wall biosynthesis